MIPVSVSGAETEATCLCPAFIDPQARPPNSSSVHLRAAQERTHRTAESTCRARIRQRVQQRRMPRVRTITGKLRAFTDQALSWVVQRRRWQGWQGRPRQHPQRIGENSERHPEGLCSDAPARESDARAARGGIRLSSASTDD